VTTEERNPLTDRESPVGGAKPAGGRGLGAFGRLLGLIAILLPLLLLWRIEGSTPVAETRRAQLLVDAPSVAALVEDTPAMEFLMRSGTSGILVQPSTIGGLLSGRDVTMATGAEILRLFRMESILNIWMWEQIKDKPVRLDATYIFTNQLILFERILETLRRELGEARVRPYRDESHDFGGELPSNYIIEAMAQPEELHSLTIGLDKTWRDSLRASGLMPVIVAGSTEDVANLTREVPALLLTGDAAARTAFSRLRPSRVYLAPGVANPGWNHARTALRYHADSGAIDADVVICALGDVPQAAAALKRKGYTIGGGRAGSFGGEERLRAEAARLWWLGLSADLLLAAGAMALAGFACAGAPRGMLAACVATVGIASIAPLFPLAEMGMSAGIAATLIAALAPVIAVRGFDSRELAAWRTISVFAFLLLAAKTRAFATPFPAPLSVSCAAIAAYAALEAGRVRVDLYILSAALVVAGGLLPPHTWSLIAASVGAGLLFTAGYDRRGVVAAALAAWPAALAAALEPTRPLGFRLFLLATVSVASLLPAVTRSRP
jgi:hypothetical protein